MWNYIKEGDLIDVVSPGKGFIPAKDIEKAQNILLYQYGIRTRIPEDLFNETSYCSNTDEYRAKSLIDAVNSKESSAVWACGGGYGSARVISKIMASMPNLQKVFIGFSDITALHLFFHQKLGWNTMHGTMFRQIGDDFNPLNLQNMMDIILGMKKSVVIDDLLPMNQIANHYPPLEGKIHGGNLSIIQTSIGTSWEIDSKDKILFIEDVGEEGYRIDRMFEHLLQSGVFDNIKALIFGEFYNCYSTAPFPFEMSLERLSLVLNKKNIPAFKTNKIGHGYTNYPIIYGAKALITSAENQYQLRLEL